MAVQAHRVFDRNQTADPKKFAIPLQAMPPNSPSVTGHWKRMLAADFSTTIKEEPMEMGHHHISMGDHAPMESSYHHFIPPPPDRKFEPVNTGIQNNGDSLYSISNGYQSNYSTIDLSQHYQDFSPPSPPPPPRIYKPCVVCSDKSSGYHYGVTTCEGCKGFFRRSVQKNMEYTCHKEHRCVINKMTRNRCQHCRLQKCVAMGMSKEAVRNDRKRKKQKEESCTSSRLLEEFCPEEENILDQIVRAHEDTFPLLTDDTKFKLSPEELEGGDVVLWERVSELSTSGIVRIVDFAKKVPGFLTLTTNDQITLLKGACLEILVLRLGSRYNGKDDTVSFSNGLTLTMEQLQTGGFGSLTDTIFRFSKSLLQMDVDPSEYALLSAICLISGDRSGLEEPEKVEKLQEPFLETLKKYVRRRRSSQPHHFAKMLMKLTDLRSISVKSAERVLHLRMDMTDDLPPLILEMLDRTENVCIP